MVDFPPCDDVCGALEQHVRLFFDGHDIEVFTWNDGPVAKVNPHFRALRVAPRQPRGLWTYVTTGGWFATEADHYGVEFILCTPLETPRAVELLAMNVFYHHGGKLGLGHTLPIGEPWLPGSACDHWLVSLPYPFGPKLQTAHVGDRHVEFLWLLPITKAERNYKKKYGLEALEQLLETVELEHSKVDRASIVSSPPRPWSLSSRRRRATGYTGRDLPPAASRF